MALDEKASTDDGAIDDSTPQQTIYESAEELASSQRRTFETSRCVDMNVDNGGCTLRALEARVAEESTARIAAEVRAERAEKRAADLHAKLSKGGEVDLLNSVGSCSPGREGGMELRIMQLVVELQQANAWARKAEEMLRERENKCDHMRRELSRLEGICHQMKLQLNSLKGTTDTAPCSPALVTATPNEPSTEGDGEDNDGANCDNTDMIGANCWQWRTQKAGNEVLVAKEATSERCLSLPDEAVDKVEVETSVMSNTTKQGCGPDSQSFETTSTDISVRPTSSPVSSKYPGTSTRHGAKDQEGAAAAAAAAAAVAAAAGGCSMFYGRRFTVEQRVATPLSPLSGIGTTHNAHACGAERTDSTAPRVGSCSSPVPGREDMRHGQRASSSALDVGLDLYDQVKCIEIPVGREDEGLLLGGGRVLHKLKEELGGTLEYRRSQGVVCVYGQAGGPRKAAACVRTALLLRDGTGEPKELVSICLEHGSDTKGGGAAAASLSAFIHFLFTAFVAHSAIVKAAEYSLGRLCMDDLLAECIALKGMGQAGGGSARRQSWSDSHPNPAAASSPSEDVKPPTACMEVWSPTTQGVGGSGSPTSGPTPSTSVAAAAAAAAAVSVASNLPDGEYPPETASLRIIGEKYGCVIDVAGEIASDAAAAAVNATLAARAAGRIEESGVLRPVGSATPVGHQDVLIWGPAVAVGEAKDAVAALVSGNACAEVVIGIKRIQRRDRGFWVNCETMANGLEIDHKRGSAWIRGRPTAVEECRREFQNKLASLFPGDFLAVPMPRAALKDLANARGLAAAAAEAKAERTGAADKGYGDEPNGVELWADWPCSSVRLRGEPAVVRRAAKALYAALARWNTLEVSVQVDRNIVTRLLSRSGRILAGISSNMGITLLVEREKGVLRGRARTEEDAKEANRVLKLKVAALSHRRSEQTNSTANSSASAPPPSKGPILSPSASSTLSERSGASVGSEDSTDDRDKELTDPFDELQAFFAGAPRSECSSDGRNPTSSSKRSCVFDGVEDVPSSTGVSGTSGGKGSTNQRNGGRGQSASSRGPSSRGGRGNGGGVVSAGSMTKSRTGYDQQQQQQHHHHVVHANRRSVIIHGPALSPSSGSTGSPSFPESIGSDEGAGRRGVGGSGNGGHHAFHLHRSSPPPPQLPPPLTSHQVHQQHYQHHHHKAERRTTWAIHREEHGHLSRHQSHGHGLTHHHGRQAQPLFTMTAPSHVAATREEIDPIGAYDERVRRATAVDVYGGAGAVATGCRGEVGYTASFSNGVVSYAGERPRASGSGVGMSGRRSPPSHGSEEFDYEMAMTHQGLVRWANDSGTYPVHPATSYSPVIRTGRTNGRGW